MVLQMSGNLINGGSALVEHNIELMRKLIESMESSNIRIRKLNTLRHKSRLTRPVEDEVSSGEEEEPIPTISAFITNPAILQPIPAIVHTATIH